MADLSITGSNVVKTANTIVMETLPAEVAITAGQALYRTTSNTYGLAQADVAVGQPDLGFVGLALNPAAAGQPVTPGAGEITIAASGLIAGTQYNLSPTAGGLKPISDGVTTGNAVVYAGVIVSATNIFIYPKNHAVLKVADE